MDKLNKTFIRGQILTTPELQQMADKIDEIVNHYNNSIKIRTMSEQALEELDAADALEGFLYCGIEGEDSTSTWHFGDRFPIRFT